MNDKEKRKAAIWAEVEKVYGLSESFIETGWDILKSETPATRYQIYSYPSDSMQIHLHNDLPADDPAWHHASIALGMNWAHRPTDESHA